MILSGATDGVSKDRVQTKKCNQWASRAPLTIIEQSYRQFSINDRLFSTRRLTDEKWKSGCGNTRKRQISVHTTCEKWNLCEQSGADRFSSKNLNFQKLSINDQLYFNVLFLLNPHPTMPSSRIRFKWKSRLRQGFGNDSWSKHFLWIRSWHFHHSPM